MKIFFALCCIGLFVDVMRIAPQQTAMQDTNSTEMSACAKDEVYTGVHFDEADQRTAFLDAKSRCMAKRSWGISASLLDKDKRVIESSYPSIRQFYISKKYTQEDVGRIIGLAWTQFRWDNRSKQLTESRFIQLSTSYGELTIKSDPAGATISVDSKPWDNPTNRTDWTEVGEHSVKLRKKGCDEATGSVTVIAGTSTTFERRLKCP